MKKIAVLGHKGGVGKTTFAASLARSLAEMHPTGLVDLDIEGSNIPLLFGIESFPEFDKEKRKILPFVVDAPKRLEVMSFGAIAVRGVPVLWGEKTEEGVTLSLVERVGWGKLNYLVADLPPGTGPVVKSFLGHGCDGAILVTIPSKLCAEDAARCVGLFREYRTPVLGEVRNFAGCRCPRCDEKIDIFPDGFSELGIPVLGEVPIQPNRPLLDLGDIPERVIKSLRRPVLLKPKRGLAGRVKRKLLEVLVR